MIRNPFNDLGQLSLDLMLPETKRYPPLTRNLRIDYAISSHVCGYLRFPKRLVRTGLSVVDRTAMPKTAVYEDCEAPLSKHNVRTAAQLLVTNAVSVAEFPQSTSQY